jgi:hypothetical protein
VLGEQQVALLHEVEERILDPDLVLETLVVGGHWLNWLIEQYLGRGPLPQLPPPWQPLQPKLMKLTGTRFPNESFSFGQIANCHICHSGAMIQSWYLALKVIIEA